MQITDARLQVNQLVLTVSNPAEAARWIYGFKSGDYEIRKARKTRSKDANAFAWAMIDKIAERTRQNNFDVYRHEIESVHGKTETYDFPKECYGFMVDSFIENHIGRSVDVIGDSRERKGNIVVQFTYGSSDYDTKQMSEFIDAILEDCRALGIETKDQGYIDSLLSEWSKHEE